MKQKGVRPVVKASAYGGLGAGLIVVLLLGSSLMPFLEYTIPAACALVIFYIAKECSSKTALICYAAASLLSVLLIPNKEAAILFALFFGYYPVFKQFAERFVKWLGIMIKALLFNASMILSYVSLIFVFGLHELWEDISLGMQYGALVLLAMGNVAFVLFDILLTRAEELYRAKQMGFRITFDGYLARAIRRFTRK